MLMLHVIVSCSAQTQTDAEKPYREALEVWQSASQVDSIDAIDPTGFSGRKERLQEVITKLEDVITKDPAMVSANYYLGYAYIHVGKKKEGIDLLYKAFMNNFHRSELSEVLTHLLVDDKQFDRANNLAKTILREKYLNEAKSLHLLAVTCYYLGDYDNALKYGLLVKNEGDVAKANNLLVAKIYYAQGDKEKAKKYLTLVMENDVDLQELYYSGQISFDTWLAPPAR